MAMLVIATQYCENYGTDTDPYWKFKGGSEYKILNVPMNIDYEEVIAAADIAYSNDYSEEYVIGWSIENDDYLSDFERNQMEYEGGITYPEKTIEYADLVAVTE